MTDAANSKPMALACNVNCRFSTAAAYIASVFASGVSIMSKIMSQEGIGMKMDCNGRNGKCGGNGRNGEKCWGFVVHPFYLGVYWL